MSPASQSTPVYSSAAVARMLGISGAALAGWEHHAVAEPLKTRGGLPLYSRDQVEQLRFIKKRLDAGTDPPDAYRELRRRVQANEPLLEDVGAGSAPRLLVLLAERDEYAARLADYFLRTEGYDVVVALSAAEAEECTEGRAPHLAIVESTISGGIGLDVCRHLKARSDAPVLVVASYDATDEALDAGADAFLLKPFHPLDLVSAVRDLLVSSAFLRPRSQEDAG